MTGACAPPRPPGPKTLLRAGAAPGLFSVNLGQCAADPVLDRGAAARRELAAEIRAAQPARPARKKRGR